MIKFKKKKKVLFQILCYVKYTSTGREKKSGFVIIKNIYNFVGLLLADPNRANRKRQTGNWALSVHLAALQRRNV